MRERMCMRMRTHCGRLCARVILAQAQVWVDMCDPNGVLVPLSLMFVTGVGNGNPGRRLPIVRGCLCGWRLAGFVRRRLQPWHVFAR